MYIPSQVFCKFWPKQFHKIDSRPTVKAPAFLGSVPPPPPPPPPPPKVVKQVPVATFLIVNKQSKEGSPASSIGELFIKQSLKRKRRHFRSLKRKKCR
jgi:hypothetical protein